MKKLFSLLLAAVMLLSCSAALADTVMMNGSVVSVESLTVTSDAAGKVTEVNVAAGDRVKAGDVLATLETTKVYAQQDGTVYLFGETGDAVDTITARYGAVAYVAPACAYTITTTTKNVYDLEENRVVMPGDKVYLRDYETNKIKGQGVVSLIDGDNFTIEITSGSYDSGTGVNIYRSSSYETTTRIGRGNVKRNTLITYTGSGTVVSYAVKSGAAVKKGDLLFETIEGTFIPGAKDLTVIKAPCDGVVASVSASEGVSLSSGGTVAVIQPDSGLRVEAAVMESELEDVQIGGKVNVELTYVSGGEVVVTGTVEKISALSSDATSEDSEESTYSVYILLDDASAVRYGMNVVVSTVEDVKPAAAPATDKQ